MLLLSSADIFQNQLYNIWYSRQVCQSTTLIPVKKVNMVAVYLILRECANWVIFYCL